MLFQDQLQGKVFYERLPIHKNNSATSSDAVGRNTRPQSQLQLICISDHKSLLSDLSRSSGVPHSFRAESDTESCGATT